jgi:hypothetical protein
MATLFLDMILLKEEPPLTCTFLKAQPGVFRKLPATERRCFFPALG